MTNSRNKQTLVIIPARGGSKGIFKKNIKDINGRTLLSYSILVAKAAKKVNRVIVSTDDNEIAKIAKYNGAEVPFMRPKRLSGDKADIGDAVDHMLKRLSECESYYPDIVAEMYPTHPFRTPELIDSLLSKIEEGHQSVITTKPIQLNNHSWYVPIDKGKVQHLINDSDDKIKIAMRPYGIFSARAIAPAPLGIYVHPINMPIQLIDIDDPEDLSIARHIVSQGYYKITTDE